MYTDPAPTGEIFFPDFCPACPPRSELTQNANIKFCRDHNPTLMGDKDRIANPDGDAYWPATNYDASDPAICDFIHRGKIARG